MDYFIAFVVWMVGGTLLTLCISAGAYKLLAMVGRLFRRRQVQQELALVKPAFRELVIKAQREVDARHGIRR